MVTIPPLLHRCEGAAYSFGGWLHRYLRGITTQWLMVAPSANPAMLEMLRDRDRWPVRPLLPWSGEFAGKYLTGAVQVYRLTHDADLRAYLDMFTRELIALQDTDGYLGPWPQGQHLTGGWDAWNHYHAMLGLLFWHEETGDAKALACVTRIADLFCAKFFDASPGERLVDLPDSEMNLAPIHALCLLYRKTGVERYLALARQIVMEFEAEGPHGPLAGDYVRTALADLDFYLTPKPRWESLHPIMGLVELYWLTGEERYRDAFERTWWNLARLERHNNGGFSSGEQARGTPYNLKSIETCSTVAWEAMCVEMLRLTGDSIIADELELTLCNSAPGLHSHTGRWVTYSTPMDGARRAFVQDAPWQMRAGSPELNCCSTNSARSFGVLSDWAIMRSADGFTVNYYGPSTMTVSLPSGTAVTLTQDTDYPRDGRIVLTVAPARAERFALDLRIPHWSQHTAADINGEAITGVRAGSYLRLDREWTAGDRVMLELDFRPHLWVNDTWPLLADWVTDWQVFGPITAPVRTETRTTDDATVLPGDHLATMPASITVDGVSYAAQTARSRGGVLDFLQLFRCGGATAYAYTEVDCPEPRTVQVAFAAENWTCWFVNGEKVFDNYHTRGCVEENQRLIQSVELPLRAGRNLIAARVTGGSLGWLLSMSDPLHPADASLRYASIYRGPILLTYDRRLSGLDADEVPVLDAAALAHRLVTAGSWIEPVLLAEFTGVDGRALRLCDHGSAGEDGTAYRSWLLVRHAPPAAEFARANPLRSARG